MLCFIQTKVKGAAVTFKTTHPVSLFPLTSQRLLDVSDVDLFSAHTQTVITSSRPIDWTVYFRALWRPPVVPLHYNMWWVSSGAAAAHFTVHLPEGERSPPAPRLLMDGETPNWILGLI